MGNRAYLVLEDSSYGRVGASWLSPGGWFFMFEDGDVRLSEGLVAYYSTVGKCKKVLSDRIAVLRPIAGQLPCPELVEYLDELLLWLSDFLPETRLLADFSELDELFLSEFRRDDYYEEDRWLSAGNDYLVPTNADESFHAYAAFNVSQWMKAIEDCRWDRVEDGLRFIGIADDVWGDVAQGKGIVIGFDEEAPIEYSDDEGLDGPEARKISPEEFLKGAE